MPFAQDPSTSPPADSLEEGRFAFGRNWQAFVTSLDQPQIDQAVESIKSMLQIDTLAGKRFLDLGCGSGLFSLAAYRLGAEVVSIDFDPDSVACANELKARHSRDGSRWQVGCGSILDEAFLSSLGIANVVYCWGVVHHTGNLMRAIHLVSDRVASGGTLFLAVYNDQGGASRRWLAIKRTYHRLPPFLKKAWVFLIAAYYEVKFALIRLLRGRNPLPFAEWRQKRRDRGMSVWHDWVDWVGGLPFETAKPEQIIVPLRQKGFVLQNLKTVGGGWGCNEYVFQLQPLSESSRLAADAAESSAMNVSRSAGETT